MNMFKKNGGFTLVELIVVIAILAILAAVAVPAYTGYIAKAEEAADLQQLSAINTATQAVTAAKGVVVESITVTWTGTASATTIDVATTGDDTVDAAVEAEILNYVDVDTLDLGAEAVTWTWADGKWE